ncbi:unnamed protein product [Leptidea sinapis]|uniref:Uncharacterized protein n=1 Tax=Leptidea sinapis TaxID=189913 RepID=A0A5E4R6K1_9NEOP|nr:unnamed protein product [Leptidea sinapis]
MAATQAESQRSETNVDQGTPEQLNESRNALLQNGTDKSVGRVPLDGVVNTKSKSPMSVEAGQHRDAGEVPGLERGGERPGPEQYGAYRYAEGADPYFAQRPGFAGKPRPPPQQRFFPGQAVSQAPGPTPTLNSLLQSSGAPPHRYPNSYEQPPAGYGPNPGWPPPRPMPPYNPQGSPYRNSTGYAPQPRPPQPSTPNAHEQDSDLEQLSQLVL